VVLAWVQQQPQGERCPQVKTDAEDERDRNERVTELRKKVEEARAGRAPEAVAAGGAAGGNGGGGSGGGGGSHSGGGSGSGGGAAAQTAVPH